MATLREEGEELERGDETGSTSESGGRELGRRAESVGVTVDGFSKLRAGVFVLDAELAAEAPLLSCADALRFFALACCAEDFGWGSRVAMVGV